MRIGVISDTHIPIAAGEIPPQILADFKKVDMIIHVGDLVDLSVYDKLKTVCSNIKVVSGNMDGHQIKEKFPEKEIIRIGQYKIGVMHGYGAPAKLIDIMNEAFKNDNVNLIIFGHSHTALNEKKGNVLYFNPGSPTDKVFSPYNSYGIIEVNDQIKAEIVRI